MNELIALGTSHKTAGVAVREKIALTEAASERFMRELVGEETISEAVVLSTCNRTELYLVVGDPVEAESIVLGALARRAGVRPDRARGRHLLAEELRRGAASLSGRLRARVDGDRRGRGAGPGQARVRGGAVGEVDRPADQQALPRGAGDRASGCAPTRRSPPAAPPWRRWPSTPARDALGDLAARHVLIIGAGETAELTARALHTQGVRTMFVANRRRERAAELARRFGGATVAFDALPEELAKADIVVASTSSPHLILGAEELGMVVPERAGRPLLLIDLAVPRDIDPACAELPGVTLLDVDGLQRQVARHQLVRRTEARKAEGIVEDEIQAFAAGWARSRSCRR
jgi:glutamyl-tRNA reductase